MLKYRLLMILGWALVPFVFIQRLLSGKDTVETFKARLGISTDATVNPRLIWLHAASLGEFNTLELLLPSISEKFPNYDLLVTVSNRLTFEKAKLLRSANLHVDIAPLDFKYVIKKFLDHWQPSCMITIENEVYPNRNLLCAQRNVPIIYVNARMSEKSFGMWAKNPKLAEKVFKCINYCFAQDEKSYDRFNRLGLADNKIAMLGNLKQFQEAIPVDHPDLHQLRSAFPKNQTLCAASTHKGEDQILLEAFQMAREIKPGLKLILVPRHANRSQEILSIIQTMQISCAVRSQTELPYDTDDVYLADTIGEMDLWYSSANVTFVAGSLVSVGGHTPYEPAAFGSAIIHGSQYSNFQAIYEQLLAEQGSLQADTAEDIAAAWLRLLDAPFRKMQVSNAKKALFENSDKDQIMGAITLKVASHL